jgi:hypothetical protein
MRKDAALYNQGKTAVGLLAHNRQRGCYRVIRDPEGVVSMWAIEGIEREPFALSFANKGRISWNIDDMPPEFVKAFVDYIKKTVKL